MHKVSITIRSPKRSGTIVFSYEQYAYDGSWEISGDSAIIYLFDQEVKRTKTLYLPYASTVDEKKGFQHLLSSARAVSSRMDGTAVSVSGDVIYPSADGSGDNRITY